MLFLAVNGTETARLVRALGQHRTVGAYRIGLWFWELEQLTPAMGEGLKELDEVWVTSPFVAQAVRRTAPKEFPVHVIPLGMRLDHLSITAEERSLKRTSLGLPDGVLIGTTFDYASRIARKNPIGVIDAFQNAFPRESNASERPMLVIKTLNADRLPADAQQIRDACARRNDIMIVDENYSSEQQSAYISCLDIAISLHRSEGYGLFPLEAMARGIPTIASNYSGNLAFMREENSWLVPCGRSTVPEESDPYPPGYIWGEPDLNAASEMLRSLYNMIITKDPELTRRTHRAIADTLPLTTGEAAAAFAKQRLAQIRK